MRFDPPFLPGYLLRRYKRFLADIELDSGELVTAHSPNTGSMAGCTEPGSKVYVSYQDKPSRKLRYTWEIASANGMLVGVHTGRTNALAEEAIAAGVVSELDGYPTHRREVKYGVNSRIDLLLEHPELPPCYVEVKNVTLGRNELAHFPDAVTARGTKHLRELSAMVAQGVRAVMLYVVQREDCRAFVPADEIDPTYGTTLREAVASGVELLAYRARVGPAEIRLERRLPINL